MDHAWTIAIPPEWATAWLPGLKVLFWVLIAILALAVLRRSFSGAQHKTIGKTYRLFFFLIALMMLGVLGYQATWQLAGFARHDFVQFMKRYNRRPDNPAARIVRGGILDRQGVGLAVPDPDRPGQRWYPGGAAFCHIVGYEHPFYGLSGVEAAEHATLSGITRDTGPEWERFRRNLIKRDDLRGHDVALTLHAALQREAHARMKDLKGAVVVIDPSDGSILVLYSAPGFDPQRLNPEWFERRDPQARLLNRATQGLYPAGSTFKVLVAAAALELGINPVLDCPAEGYQVGTGNRPIRDHEYYDYQRRGRTWPGHGALNMRDAMTKSSNIYFAKLGVQVGGERLVEAVHRMGLPRSWILLEGSSGNLTTSAGRFPNVSNRDTARTAQVSIGQGEMLTTPFHLAMLAGAIGRQGAVWKPRLLAQAPPQPLEPMMSAATARALGTMMRQAVTHGTGRAADIPGLNVAGKTGTAQNPHGADHGWFIGFAPAQQPKLAFAVVVEQGGYGSQSALPVAAAILRKAQAIGYFDEDARQGTQ
ncbi:MAG TPA: penicillin-binding transpeptidase domain-containing protein [Kiritimatiellia bacterium]|nr:penicillin-binding transpeptidase domain-containing protein [Kiritimatiellia bacterium]HMP00011.1 penicillin-binding transpeptidase domain-containing protein [Kiritimatiellia bacterium]HMP97759.1 penicillin-binding transpeptidase domain-containing protein [Kiritimatiellia bacterium]